MLTRQLRTSGNAVSDFESMNTFADCNDPRTEFMPKELYRSFCLKPATYAVISKSRDAESKLRFRYTWLNTKGFHQHMTRLQFGDRNVIKAEIAESIESPGSHFRVPLEVRVFG